MVVVCPRPPSSPKAGKRGGGRGAGKLEVPKTVGARTLADLRLLGWGSNECPVNKSRGRCVIKHPTVASLMEFMLEQEGAAGGVHTKKRTRQPRTDISSLADAPGHGISPSQWSSVQVGKSKILPAEVSSEQWRGVTDPGWVESLEAQWRKALLSSKVGPSSRQHVSLVEEWIAQSLEACWPPTAARGGAAGATRDQMQTLLLGFEEVVRQVKHHCEERGNLLMRIWMSLNDLLERVLNEMSRALAEAEGRVEHMAETLAAERGARAAERMQSDTELQALEEELNAKWGQRVQKLQAKLHQQDAQLEKDATLKERIRTWLPNFGIYSGSVLLQVLPPLEDDAVENSGDMVPDMALQMDLDRIRHSGALDESETESSSSDSSCSPSSSSSSEGEQIYAVKHRFSTLKIGSLQRQGTQLKRQHSSLDKTLPDITEQEGSSEGGSFKLGAAQRGSKISLNDAMLASKVKSSGIRTSAAGALAMRTRKMSEIKREDSVLHVRDKENAALQKAIEKHKARRKKAKEMKKQKRIEKQERKKARRREADQKDLDDEEEEDRPRFYSAPAPVRPLPDDEKPKVDPDKAAGERRLRTAMLRETHTLHQSLLASKKQLASVVKALQKERTEHHADSILQAQKLGRTQDAIFGMLSAIQLPRPSFPGLLKVLSLGSAQQQAAHLRGRSIMPLAIIHRNFLAALRDMKRLRCACALQVDEGCSITPPQGWMSGHQQDIGCQLYEYVLLRFSHRTVALAHLKHMVASLLTWGGPRSPRDLGDNEKIMVTQLRVLLGIQDSGMQLQPHEAEFCLALFEEVENILETAPASSDGSVGPDLIPVEQGVLAVQHVMLGRACRRAMALTSAGKSHPASKKASGMPQDRDAASSMRALYRPALDATLDQVRASAVTHSGAAVNLWELLDVSLQHGYRPNRDAVRKALMLVAEVADLEGDLSFPTLAVMMQVVCPGLPEGPLRLLYRRATDASPVTAGVLSSTLADTILEIPLACTGLQQLFASVSELQTHALFKGEAVVIEAKRLIEELKTESKYMPQSTNRHSKAKSPQLGALEARTSQTESFYDIAQSSGSLLDLQKLWASMKLLGIEVSLMKDCGSVPAATKIRIALHYREKTLLKVTWRAWKFCNELERREAAQLAREEAARQTAQVSPDSHQPDLRGWGGYMSYAEVLKRAQEEGEAGGLALVLVLQACGEAVVGGQGRDPTPTELFAGLLASLEASDQGHACEVAVLLEMVLPMVAKGVVKERFEPIADAIMRVIKVYTAAGEREITETAPALLLCLGHTLSSLGLNDATWSNSRVVRVFNFLMGYFSHKQVKLRLASQEAAVLVLEAQAAARERRGSGKKSQGASPLVHGFCSAVLSAVTAQDTSHSLQLLKFMRKAAPLLPTASALALCNQCLKLPNLGNPTLTRASMHFLSAVVQSPALKCEASGIVGLIKSSIDIQPSANDQAGAVSYSQHIASCFVKCQALDPAAARSLLPQVSTSLARYCESSQSAVHKTACFALHTCFQAVVDQHMITDLSSCLSKQGRSSTDCPLGATLAILESLLEYRFQKAWVYALPLLGRLFLHLRSAAYPILASVLRGLDNLHAALGAAPAAALPGVLPALLEAIGFAVEGIGMKNTLTLLPLRPAGTPNAVGVAHSRGYLLPILREHGGSYPSELHYFHTQVLSVARLCDSLVRGGTCTANEMATQKTRVVQLWQLLSAVCVCPTDISSQFDTLAPLLANALHDQRYGTLLAEVCAGLVVLVAGVKDRAQGGDTKAKADLATIAATTPKFLPLLLSLLERSPALSPAQATAVCSAASALASIAPAAFVSQLFKKVLQKLLVGAASNTAPGTAQAAIFFELVASLVPSLSPECAALAFRAAKPSTSASGKGQQQPAAGLQQLQKKAYRVLLALCQHQPAVIISGEHGLEALEFFAASQAACHVGSRVLRLGCLMKLAAALAGRPESRAGCEMMISEALLCTKDSNRRTREAAYDLLLVLAPGVGGPRELVVMVVAALAAQTAHMRSAAVLGLSRLQYEYAHFRSEAWDAAVVELTPSLVRTVLLLLQEEHREVIKASLGYLRVAVGGADRKLLEPLLPEIVTGVMGLDKDARGKFKAKMRVVLSKLTRKFGFDRIKDLVPERDRKLVTHMQKEAERELRAKAARKEERDAGAGRVAGAGRSRSERFESVLDGEDDDDEEEAPGQKGKGKMKEKGSMREEGVVDLLDGSAIRNMQVMDSDSDDAGMGEADLAVGKDGKLIIPDDDEDEEGTSGGLLGNKRKKGVEADDDDDDDDDEGNGRWASASRGKQQKGAAQSHQQRNKKTKVGHGSHSAEQFKSRKAGGDVKRKGQKLEPYAYIPLDPKALTSKKGAARREALNAYDKVGKGQKKGYKNRYGQDSRAGH